MPILLLLGYAEWITTPHVTFFFLDLAGSLTGWTLEVLTASFSSNHRLKIRRYQYNNLDWLLYSTSQTNSDTLSLQAPKHLLYPQDFFIF